MSKKTRAQLEAELSFVKHSRIAEGIVNILSSFIRWGSLVLIARYTYLGIEALAGKATLADVGIKFLTNIKIEVALAWCAAGGGMLYGYQQRRMRKDTVERLQNRIQELEQNIDPKRSSSKLTPRGDTRPEDRR